MWIRVHIQEDQQHHEYDNDNVEWLLRMQLTIPNFDAVLLSDVWNKEKASNQNTAEKMI